MIFRLLFLIASSGLLISIPVTCFYMSFVFHFISSDIYTFIIYKMRKPGGLPLFFYPLLPPFSSFSSPYYPSWFG